MEAGKEQSLRPKVKLDRLGRPVPSRVRAPEVEKARMLYMDGSMSLADACRSTGANYQYTSTLSYKEKWAEQRAESLRRIEADADEALARMVAQRRRKAIKDQLDRAQLLHSKGTESLQVSELTPGQAIDALRVASEMERKVLKLEEQAPTAQVNILMPLFAASEAQHVQTMLMELNDGKGQPEEASGGGADSPDEVERGD